MSSLIFKPKLPLSFDSISKHAAAINELVSQLSDQSFIFDLSQVEKCDSAGLALLIDTVSKLRKRSVCYRFEGMQSSLKSLATFYEVDSLLSDVS